MLFRDVITLVAVTISTNALGDIINTPTTKQVFANKKSVRQSEFYQAQANGLKAEVMFEIRAIDYSEEESLTFDSKDYKVIRTYSKNGETIELICTRLVNS